MRQFAESLKISVVKDKNLILLWFLNLYEINTFIFVC